MKAVNLNKDTTILCFDVESNGLHGEAFAVGAMLITVEGEIKGEFAARCPIDGYVDPWVEENVLPSLEALPITHKTLRKMRRAFWAWYIKTKPKADFVLVDNGYPVEARFLIACQDDDPAHRYAEHPFPLLDLSSLLVQAGYEPLADREKLVKEEIEKKKILKHNPTWDAWVTALAAIKAMRRTGRLK